MVQERDPNPAESQRGARGWRPIGLAAIGIGLIVFAVIWLMPPLEATSDTGTVTVKCGNAFDAMSVESGDPIEVVEGADDPRAGLVLAGIADDCRAVGTSRILVSSVLGVLGVIALVLARRITRTA